MEESQYTKLKSKFFEKKMRLLPIFVLFGLFLFFSAAGFFSRNAWAATAPTIITYQGKLLSSGALPTQSFNMYFILYDAPSGGNVLYTASGTIGSPDYVSTMVSSGVFTVNLGDSGTNSLDPSIFRDNNSVYLEVQIGAQTLVPRKRITSVPYAFNAKYLDGIGLNTLTSTTYIPLSDANGNFLFNSTTITTGTISNLVAGFTTSTALYVSGTSSFAGLLTFTTASGTAVTSTNAYITNLVVGNCVGCGVGGGGGGVSTSTANYFAFYTGATTVTGTSFVQFANGAFTIATDTIMATTTINGPLSFAVASGTSITSTNLTITGGLSLPNGSVTDAMVANDITAANYLPLVGGTLSGPLFFSAASGTTVTSTNGMFVGVSTTNLFVSGSVSLPNDSITNSMVVDALTINGGAIDNTPIGANTPSTGVFTTLRATSLTSTNFFATTSILVDVSAANLSSTNLYISGSVNLPNNSVTDAMLADNITAANYLLLTGGTLTGALTFTTASGTAVTSTNAYISNLVVGSCTGCGGAGGSGGVNTSTANYFAFYTSATTVTGTSFVQFSNGKLTISTSTSLATTTINGPLEFTVASGTSITSTNIVVTNKIGVGTSTPTQALSVVGNISNVIDQSTSISEVATVAVGSSPQSIFVSGRYAYTANQSADTISIVDISNPLVPVQIATAPVGVGPYAVFVSGRYAYVANRSSASLSVVDISNPVVPVEVATTSVGNGAQSIFVSGRYAYVANALDDSVSVVDISNPFSPIQIATTSVGANPKSIFVSGRYAYTANAGNGDPGSNSVSVVDISNPSAPNQVATSSAGDVSLGIGPNQIFVSGRYAYTVNADDTFSVIDVSNAYAPVEVATTTAGAGLQSLYVSGRYAYVTNNSDSNISVIDISNPLSPRSVGLSGSIVGGPKAIFVSGRYAYVANSDDTISVVDISGAEVTSLIAHSAEAGQLQIRNDIFAQGNVIAGTSLLVGAGGIQSQGGLSVFASSTGVTSSIFSVGSTISSSTLRVFADGTILLGTSTFFAPITFTTASGTSLTSTNALFTNVTSTNLNISSRLSFLNATGTSVTSTNLYISGTSNFVGALVFATASGTSITSTNAFFTNLSATNFNPASISAVNITSTNLFATSAVFSNLLSTNATSTNLYVSGLTNLGGALTFTTASGTSITSTNAFFTNFSATNFTLANISATSITSTNLFATSSVFNTTTINRSLGIGTTTPAQALSVVGGVSNILDANTNISLVTSSQVGGSTITSLFVVGRYLYITNQTAATLSVVDVTNPSTPVLISTTSVSAGPAVVKVVGRYAFVSYSTTNSLTIIDISNPKTPAIITTTSMTSGPIAVSGRHVYSVNGTLGRLTVTDVTNPSAPFSAATLSGLAASQTDIFIQGTYVYFTNSTGKSLSIVDVSNPTVPVSVGSASLNASPLGVYVSGRYAYTANSTSNTISVIDVSNPASPTQVGTTTVGASPERIFVSGRYAFTADATSNTVSVVDVSNPSSPTLVKTFSVSANGGTQPRSIFVAGRYLYVGHSSNTNFSIYDISGIEATSLVAHSAEIGNLQIRNDLLSQGNITVGTSLIVGAGGITSYGGLSVFSSSTGVTSTIFNVGSKASTSTLRVFSDGTIQLTTTTVTGLLTYTTANGTSITSTNAFFTNLNFTSASTTNLFSTNTLFVNVSSTNLFSTNTLFVNATTTNLFATSSIFVNLTATSMTSTNLYISSLASLANVLATSVTSTNLFVTNTVFVNTIATSITSTNLFATTSIFNTTTINRSLGIGTSTPSQALSVVGNISNITSASTTLSQVATVSVGAGPSSVFVSGKYAYVVSEASSTLSVIDVSNPSVPTTISTTTVNGITGVFVSGRYAYTTGVYDPSASVVDISNPFAPTVVSPPVSDEGRYNIFISGKYAYTAYFAGDTLEILDVSNPKIPERISTLSVGTGPFGVYVSGRYAYVTKSGDNAIAVVDVSNPSTPVVAGTVSVGDTPKSVYVSGRYAYVANSGQNGGVAGTISVVDISKPTAPVQVATASVGGSPQSIYVSGRYAYVANSASNTVSVVDVSNPAAPVQITTIAVGTGPQSIYISGRYAYVANNGSNNLSIVDISGTEVSSLIAHSAEVGSIQSRNDIFAQGNIMAGTSLMVGAGGILSQGTLSVFASSSDATSSIFNIASIVSSSIINVFANGRIGIGTASFSGTTSTLDVQGQVEVNLSSPGSGAATFALCHTNDGATSNQVIYDCNGGATADYMEMYAADVGLEKGDIVALSDNFVQTSDGNTVPKLSKSSSAYQSTIIGVISDVSQAGDFNSIGHNVSESDNPLPLALAGRIPVKVTNVNGDIHVGDKLTSSNIPGVAMKATGQGQTIGVAMGNYSSADVGLVMTFVNLSWNSNLYRALTVDESANVLTVGSGSSLYNLSLNGNIVFNQNDINKLTFATSTLFESSVGNFSAARAFTFNAINFTNPTSDNYIISLRANNNSVFSVAANGDVHALGNYYGASAVLGTSTNPGDLAERVDIAMDDTVEPGDVMMVDGSAPDTYRRSTGAYEQSVAGVISTNPTIVVGNGRTDYTAVLAMVGRVPIKVSDENGAVSRGDLLVSASRVGYAMKYDPTKDKDNRVVGIIGLALESLPPSSSGKILALVRTGWVYNRDEDIKKLRNNIEQVALSQGIDLDAAASPENLNIENANNQLVYSGGNLNLQNHSLISVSSIIGSNNKWRIDEFGNLVQRISTVAGDKDIYSLQSSIKQEIVISGTSTLENGSKRVMLTELDQAVIDRTVPLKIMITPSGETFGVYVAERSYDSFLVKENGNGISNAEFDWTVIAKVLSSEEVMSPTEDTEVPAAGNNDIGEAANNTSTEEAPTSSDPVVADPVVPYEAPNPVPENLAPVVPTVEPSPEQPVIVPAEPTI